jgi:hypothetical protein
VSPLIKECRKETPNLGSVCMSYGEKNSTLHPRLAKMKRNINSNKEHRYCTSIKYLLEVRYVSEAWNNFKNISQN